jgi:hypothetical protein
VFGDRHYVPILKGKDGEYRGLEDLFAHDKLRLTPLIEVIPVGWDYENEQPLKSVAEHLAPVAGRLRSAWGTERPLFLDVELLDEDDVGGGVHPLEFVLQDTRQLGVRIIPVTGLQRTPPYQAAVAAAVVQDGEGVCIRITPEDLARGAIAAELPQILQALGIAEDQTDLLLDYGALEENQTALLTMLIPANLNAIPNINGWRTLTVAGTGFPINLSGFSSQSISHRNRVEWHVWIALRAMPLPRTPTFGDYAIAHPEMTEMDPRLMRQSASIRYTTDDSWLISKGRDLRTYGFAQFHQLAQHLAQRPEFSGAGFSWGDGYIHDCGNGQCGPGNATTWRRVGVNHHLTKVVNQVANLP